MRKIFYFDSDGCLAKWKEAASPSDLRKENYFFELDPEWKLIVLLLLLKIMGYDVYIMTKASVTGFAMRDKNRWYDKYFMKHIPRIFVPYEYGSKEDFVIDPEANNILLDDYSENLREWDDAGYKAVKFFNGINGTKGTWKGDYISHDMPVIKMYKTLTAI